MVLEAPIYDPLWTSREPFLDENYSNEKGIPTQITRGLFKGYSMDIWETPAKPYEELSFRLRVPHEWNGITNPWIVAITAPSGNETINNKYQFRLEWQSGDIGSIIPDTIQETLTYEVTLINSENVAWFAHIIAFKLTSNSLISGQNLQFRIRRIAASSNEVINEPVIFHWDTRWKFDKSGTESIQCY